MDISYTETVLEELQASFDTLSASLDDLSLDRINQDIDDILIRVSRLGICQKDGEELHRLGVLSKEAVQQLRQHRVRSDLETVGIEVDKSGVSTVLSVIGIAGLSALVGYLVSKLLNFVFGLFGNSDTIGGSKSIKAELEKSAKEFTKSIVSEVNKQDARQRFLTAMTWVESMPAKALFSDGVQEKFLYLKYPGWSNKMDWVTAVLDAIQYSSAELVKTKIPRDTSKEYMERSLKTAKLGRKDLGGLEGFSRYLEAVFGQANADVNTEGLSAQSKTFKDWKANRSWDIKPSDDMLRLSLSELTELKKNDVELIRDRAKGLEENLKQIEEKHTKVDVSDRSLKPMMTTYLRLTIGDPIGFMRVLLQKLIIPYLNHRIKFTVKALRVIEHAAPRLRNIYDYTKKKSGIEDFAELLDNLPEEFVKQLNEKDLPERLTPYKVMLKDKPKKLDELMTRVVAIEIEK